jgi:streptomycin 6-kinase
MESAERNGWIPWIESLPGVVGRLEAMWSLRVGPPFEPGGKTAWVAPAVCTDGAHRVVKVMRRHSEGEHEAEGLRLWDGDGAVRLHAVEETPDTIALLLERCLPGSNLTGRPEDEQDVVITGLLRRLWRLPPPGHTFPALQSMCDQWADGFERRVGSSTLDAGLAREGSALFRRLPSTVDVGMVLCTDLHAGNVVAAQREPWLVIDPKPFVGDTAYDVTQHLLNCGQRLLADPRGLARRVSELAGQDGDRVLDWLFARCVVDSFTWPELVRVARMVAP